MKCNQHLINLRKVFWNGHQSAINEVVICVQVFKHILQWYGLFPCLVEVSSKVLYFRPSSTSTDVALYGLFQLSQRYFPDNIWSSQTFFSPVSLSSSEKKKKILCEECVQTSHRERLFFCILFTKECIPYSLLSGAVLSQDRCFSHFRSICMWILVCIKKKYKTNLTKHLLINIHTFKEKNWTILVKIKSGCYA